MEPEDVACRLDCTFDLFEAGRDLMIPKLRRAHPDESDEQLRRRLGEWLRGGTVHLGRPYSFRHTTP